MRLGPEVRLFHGKALAGNGTHVVLQALAELRSGEWMREQSCSRAPQTERRMTHGSPRWWLRKTWHPFSTSAQLYRTLACPPSCGPLMSG